MNTTFNIGIAGGAVLGGRELLHSSPPALAFTGATLLTVALGHLLIRPPSTAA